MDPLTVIGLIGNIVQFVDFTSKLLSKAGEVYRSADGALVENTDLEMVANDLIALCSPKYPDITILSENPALDALWSGCEEVGKKLVEAWARLKIQGQKTKWNSFRKALKSVWSKEEIETLLKRLSSFRDELNLRILVDLREPVNFSEIRQSKSFLKLDGKSQQIVNLIVQQQDVFTNRIQKQTEEIKALHAESKATIIEQHATTRVEIVQAIQVTKESSEADQVATRQEIANLKAAIKELSEQMKQKDAELSQFLKEFREARTEKKKKALQERSNAISAT